MSVLVEARIRQEQIDIAGLRVRYLTGGDGSPVVLLHGDGESAADWSWVLPALASTHRVYAPDLPGHGDTDKPQSDYTPESLTHFVTELIDAWGLDRVALVGNSMGGLIALSIALEPTRRVTSLCLVDSAGLGRFISPAITGQALPGVGEMLAQWGKRPLGARQLAWTRALLFFAQPFEAPKEWLDEQTRLIQLPGFMEAVIASMRSDLTYGMQRILLLDRLPELSMPVHLIWGERDRVLPVSQAREAVRRLSHGSLTVIPYAGHLPQVERPGEFLKALLPALRQTDGSP